MWPGASGNTYQDRRADHSNIANRIAASERRSSVVWPDAIKSLLRLSRHADEPCHEANAIAEEQLTAVRSRLARLQALEEELSRMVGVCEGGTVEHCRVIEVLENHALCLHDHEAGK
ncbi:MerR family DNA-binding protein [Saccharospirillum sp.]|uniref:MerR family DNA-binding protein n=1 Tax=Saccharospirillum sp. TaxID=2033801 RepID=UPI0034A0A9BB